MPSTYEKLVTVYQSTRCHIPEHLNLVHGSLQFCVFASLWTASPSAVETVERVL